MITKKRGLGDLNSGIADAIARMEGFYSVGSIAQRNNNPGNLRSGQGQIGSAGGFAVFPDVASGWAALERQIDLNISRGLNLYQFFGGEPGVYAGYAPSSDSNNPTYYADFVANVTGIDPNLPLNAASGSPPDPSQPSSISDRTGRQHSTSPAVSTADHPPGRPQRSQSARSGSPSGSSTGKA